MHINVLLLFVFFAIKSVFEVANNTQPSFRYVLPLVVVAQFACTSLWFAGNAIIHDVQTTLELPESIIGHITSAVQFGFIIGTLVFAIFTITDRFSPSKIFLFCALAGAITNMGILFSTEIIGLLSTRFLTGFFLAGIYPVGMKIAADYREKGLNTALGWLVGALVFGTSFPHLLNYFSADISWENVVVATTVIATLGGLLIALFVGDGPYRKKSTAPDFKKFFTVFREPAVRKPAFGYFGHMWELYSFWAFVPIALAYFMKHNPGWNVSFWAFAVIGAGGVGCIAGGYVAQRIGSHKTATYALSLSGICCLLSPFIFTTPPLPFILFLIFWGIVVVADSPQFSTLVATAAPKESVGTALTIMNCIGFSITIVSIQLITLYMDAMDTRYLFLLLAPGPLFGVLAMRK